MLITIILNGVVSLSFGFTTNIVYAFTTRFLTGLVNGRTFSVYNMSCCVKKKKKKIWVPTRFDTNQAVLAQKIIRSFKFWIYEEEGLDYPCSENKVSYCTVDLRLCFRICRLLFSYAAVHIIV